VPCKLASKDEGCKECSINLEARMRDASDSHFALSELIRDAGGLAGQMESVAEAQHEQNGGQGDVKEWQEGQALGCWLEGDANRSLRVDR
jgi:hypothetical protein